MIARLGHLILTGGWTLAALLGLRLAFGLYRFARLPKNAKRNYPAALWARARWRWLTRNLQLAYLDQHRRASRRPAVPFGTSVKVKAPTPGGPARLRFPRARFTADEFGIIARVRTVPGVGRAEFDRNAAYIADAWRCVRVQVTQPKPGRVIVRGLRTDPLTVPLSSNPAHGPHVPLRLYIGRDEWGADRWLPLTGVTGIVVGGLPGYGKTNLINHWLAQLAPHPVAFVIVDGKDAGEYDAWRDRCWLYAGDELPDGTAVLEDVHSLMRARRRTVLEHTGHRNGWHAGPVPAFPVVFTVIDECHGFFDLDAVKGDRASEQYVRTCRALSGQLVKKGRSMLFITVFVTQKPTADAIPTAIRDNCGLALSFAVKTKEAAVAVLGDHIRDHDTYCPTGLQDPAYVGVATASLRTGYSPFVRVRVPELTEDGAAERASITARIDPAAVSEVPASDPDHTLPLPR